MSRLVSASRAIARFTTRPTTTRRGVSRAVVRPRAASVSSSTSASASPSWKFRLLYDGGCPLCVREVEFLRAKDAGKGKLSLVDIAADDYDASDNAGIDYETAMATIHGLDADKKVYTGVEVFERAYDAVGIGYVYAFTRVPALLKAANAVYDVWAKYRLNVTNRGSLAEHLAAREQRLSGKTCGVDKEACEETTTKA